MKNLDLRFTYIESVPMALLLVAAAMAVTALLYLRAFRGRFAWIPLVLTVSRALACAACLAILLRPVVSYDLVAKKESRVAVLVDRSLSMGIADSVGGETRLASALRVARGASVARLGEIYHLEAYSFPGGKMLPGNAIPELPADGPRTDLAAAWQGIRPAAEKLEAVVLLSDGRDNRPERFRGGEILPPAPIYAVGLGSGLEGAPDLAIARIETEEKILQGNRVEVRVGIRSRGLPLVGTELSVLLEGREVLRRDVKVEPGESEARFPLVPDRTGQLTYEVRLAERPGELFRENNVRHFSLDVSEKLLQVLLYDARVRWEYKFLRETLARDPDVNPTGVVKTRGDRVLQQGAAPVDLSKGLPASRAEWRKFDVLILGDVRPEDFPPGALEVLKAWVAEDGGGLIYLGGPGSYGEMAGSPLAEALPLELRSGGKLPGKPRVVPSPTALDHPVLRGIAGFFLPECPGGPFGVEEAFGSGGLRPGADAILLFQTAPEAQGKEEKAAASPAAGAPAGILLAAQQYGRGRTAAYLTDSDWRWVMLRGAEGGRTLHGRLWGQMVRWAARRDDAGAEGALAVRLPRRVAMAGERTRVEVRGSKERLGSLAVEALGPGGSVTAVSGAVSGDLWSGEFVPEAEGKYEIRASATGAAQGAGQLRDRARDQGIAPAALLVEPSTLEMEEPLPDWDLLRDLAARTGGKFFSLPEVGTLADSIIKDRGDVTTHVELGTERNWWLFLAIVLLFTLEWALRRKIFVV